MTGAMAPDSVFNYMFGPNKDRVKTIAGWAHGEAGDDLFGYFGRFKKLGIEAKHVLPFGLGVICHLCADMAFHPLVFYFCGKDSPGSMEATYRHLALETEIDKRLRWFYPELRHIHIRDFYSRIECNEEIFARMLKSVHLNDDNLNLLDDGIFSSMYRQHCSHDMLYGKRPAELFAKFLSMLTLGKRKEPAMLFYTDIKRKPDPDLKESFENEVIEFRNPASGENMRTSFNGLVRNFFSLFSEYAKALVNILENGQPEWDSILKAVSSWTPLSPHCGLAMIDNSEPDMKYFEIKAFTEIWSIERD
jgi:hypothetical protein